MYVINALLAGLVSLGGVQSVSTMYDINTSGPNSLNTASDPDMNKNMPKWANNILVYKDVTLIKRLMNVTSYKRPLVRMWHNLSDKDKLKCPECDGTYNDIVGKEIWLTDDATKDDMIIMIIMYFQIVDRGMKDSMIFSSIAEGEREFFLEQWRKFDKVHLFKDTREQRYAP